MSFHLAGRIRGFDGAAPSLSGLPLGTVFIDFG